MKLADYRARERRSRREIAEALGVSEVSVGRYESGERIPEKDVMARLYDLTSGAVTANDFYGLPASDEAAA